MTTIQTVQEQPTEHSAAEGASSDQGAPDEPQASPAAERRRSPARPPAAAAEERHRRRPFLGQTAAVTIIAALIASLTLAAVTGFNTIRSDIGALRTEMRDEFASVRTEIASVRTEMRDEFASVRTEMRDEIASVRTEIASVRTEIASVRTELHEFRTEVTAVLLDHAERLARIETLILNGAISPPPSQQP